MRRLEKLGTTDLATLFVYFLIMTIGMRLNLANLGGNLGLFLVAIIWMLIHIVVMLTTARLIRAPYFFVAVGSQANIGGVSTAPAVASIFHPALAPVGVLLAVLGHILGTYRRPPDGLAYAAGNLTLRFSLKNGRLWLTERRLAP